MRYKLGNKCRTDILDFRFSWGLNLSGKICALRRMLMLLFTFPSAQNFFFHSVSVLYTYRVCVSMSSFRLSFITMSNGEKSEETETTVIRFLREKVNV